MRTRKTAPIFPTFAYSIAVYRRVAAGFGTLLSLGELRVVSGHACAFKIADSDIDDENFLTRVSFARLLSQRLESKPVDHLDKIRLTAEKRNSLRTSQAGIQTAVEGLTRALAVELAPIRANAVSPGLSRTPRWDSWTESFRQAFYEREEKRLPVGHLGEASELATAYLYLMENSFATGTVILADGGGALV